MGTIEDKDDTIKGQKADPSTENDDATFENSNVDPGFVSSANEELTGEEDERSHNIDSSASISEMRQKEEEQENDAMNLGSDRENGSYNPKNI